MFVRMKRLAVAITCAASVAALSNCAVHVSRETLQSSDIETTVFFIGDAGEPDPRQRSLVLDSLSTQAASAPARSLIVFLGDNVYPNGIPEEGQAEYADARRRLQSQVDAIPKGVRGIFIPGNHDWGGETGEPFGLFAIRLEEKMIATMAAGRDIKMLPVNGCPGPAPVDVGRLRLLLLDTQWWLHDYIVHDASSNCETTTGAVTETLRQLVEEKMPGRVTIVAGHHPLMTGGEHGGYCGIVGPFRRFGGSPQDILSGQNRTMRDSIESAFRKQPPLAFVAGHDHNLQVLKGDPNIKYILVSGAGSETKLACTVRLRESYYTAQHRTGFMRVDIMRNKGVLLSVYQYASSGIGGLSYTKWLELR